MTVVNLLAHAGHGHITVADAAKTYGAGTVRDAGAAKLADTFDPTDSDAPVSIAWALLWGTEADRQTLQVRVTRAGRDYLDNAER